MGLLGFMMICSSPRAGQMAVERWLVSGIHQLVRHNQWERHLCRNFPSV